MTKKNNKLTIKELEKVSRSIKKNIIKISYKAHVGHIGSALSIADILAVLYHAVLKNNPQKPNRKNRDRFILSKGHAAAALYTTLYSKGYFSRKVLFSFCKDGGIFGVHPVYDLKYGIELSTGSLGHGLSIAAGLAMGLAKNSKKNPPTVYVLLSDAELNEGSTWEAIMFASHHNLNNLVAILDDNNYQAFGKASAVINIQPTEEKWGLFGWNTKIVDGHNIKELYNAFRKESKNVKKPTVIVAKTTTAKGISFLENTQEAHYLPLNTEQYKIALIDLKKRKL